MTTQSKQTLVNNVNTYYWLTSQQLGKGSIVEPGTWYRIISSTRNHSHALLEEVFERVRRDNYPLFPSRQRSMYLFDSIETARQFKVNNKWMHTDLYEVEVVNPSAKQIRTNSDLVKVGLIVNNVDQLYSTKELEEWAQKYWSSANKECSNPEWLMESPIRIIGKLSL